MSSKTYSAPFRISLPSNANRAMYPDNLAGKFTVELPVTIQLDHGLEWELALEEMFWPIHGDFINPSTLWMEIHWPRALRRSYERVSIPSEHLSDFSSVIAFLKSKFNDLLRVEFDEVLEIVKFTYVGPTSDQLRVYFSNKLALLLGYNLNVPFSSPKTNRAAADARWASTVLKLSPNESNHRLILRFEQGLEIIHGNQAPSVYFPSQFLHVHSNLTVPTYCNGKLTSSLRVIRLVQNKVNKYVRHIAPKQPQYFEVIQKSMNGIEIELRDDQGRIFLFS